MTDVTAATTPLVGAFNKIKESAMHVVAQVRAEAPSPRDRISRGPPDRPPSVVPLRPHPQPPLTTFPAHPRRLIAEEAHDRDLDRTAYQRPTSFSEVRPRPDANLLGIDRQSTIVSPTRVFPFLRVAPPSPSRRRRSIEIEMTSHRRLPSRAFAHPSPSPRSNQATGRIQKNLNYFKINYFLFTVAVLAAFIVTNPASLLVLSTIGAAWTYVYLIRTEPLKIGERPVSDREKMLGMSGASLLAVFSMSSAGSLMFQAFGVALLAIGAHGAMRVPDDLFIDDAAGEGGFFSFLQPPDRDSPGRWRKTAGGAGRSLWGARGRDCFYPTPGREVGAVGGAVGTRPPGAAAMKTK